MYITLQYNIATCMYIATQARVLEFVRGGGQKLKAFFFFFFLLFNFSGGGGPAQKIAQKNSSEIDIFD